MKKLLAVGLIFLATTVGAQNKYLITVNGWSVCTTAQLYFPGGSMTIDSRSAGTHGMDNFYFAQAYTYNGSMDNTSIEYYIDGEWVTCCNSDCNNFLTYSLNHNVDNGWSMGYRGVGRLDVAIMRILPPVVQSNACDYVDVVTQGDYYYADRRFDWEVSANGVNGWQPIPSSPISGGQRVTAAAITANTNINPYGSLYIRYKINIYEGYNGSTLRYITDSPVIPISLYHAAPVITLTPTNRICTSKAGVRVTSATLALPKVRVVIRRKINGVPGPTVVGDTEYNANAFVGTYYNDLEPGEYQMAARNGGGGVGDECPAFIDFTIGETHPVVDIQAAVTHENCFGPANTGSIAITAGGAGITSPLVYTWAHGPTTPNLTNLAGDVTYTVTVNDANGCTGTRGIRVEEPDVVAVTSAYVTSNHTGADVSCHPNADGTHNDGAINIEASGGTGTLSYRLAGASYNTTYQTAATISNLYPDVYTVYVRDANGCEVVSPTTVPITAPSEITYGSLDLTQLRCNGIAEGAIIVTNANGGRGTLQYAVDGGVYQPSNSFLNLLAGTHTVSIRDANGCRRDIGTTLTQPLAITFSDITLQPQSCVAVVDGAILVTAGGGTGALQYALVDELTAYQSSGEFTSRTSGTYTIYARDASSCVSSAVRILPMKPSMTANIQRTNNISCFGDADGALRVNVTGGGTAPYSIAWADGRTTQDITDLTASTYTVTVTDAKTCVQSWDYPLTGPALLALQPHESEYNGFGVRCEGSTDGAIDLEVLGGTGPFQYNWSDGPASEDRTALPKGTYSVSVTDSKGCNTAANNIVITEPPSVNLAVESFETISCYSFEDGSVTLLSTGGVGVYRYSRNGTTWRSTPTYDTLVAGDYTFYMRDGNGCAAAPRTITLSQPTALELTVTRKDETKCGQANGALGVTLSGGVGGYTYAWYQGAELVATTAEVLNLASGDYQLRSRDANACEVNQTFIINDSDGPKVTQQALQGLTCHDSNDGFIQVSINEGLAPYTQQWDLAGQTGLAIENIAGGEHWIEVLDARGCRNKTTFWVDYPAAMAITPTLTLPLCVGDNNGSIDATATGGNAGGYTYLWTTGETTPRLAALQAGQYQVTVKDSRNCTLVKDITLLDPPRYTVDAGGDRTICVGQKLTIQGPEDAVSYRWTSDAGYESTTRNVVLTIPAQYTLEVINGNGCVAEDHFALATSDDLLQADFLMAAQAHAGDTIVLVDISWPMPENIGWSFPEGTQVVETDEAYASIVFPAAGTYTVTLNTYLGECIDDLVKEIAVLGALPSESGRVAEVLVKRFDVSPNPSDGVFAIHLEFSSPVTGKLAMIGLSGNRMLWHQDLSEQTSYEVRPELQQLPAGIYLVVLESGNKRYYKRIIKK